MKQVKLNKKTDEYLTELSKARKADEHLNCSKQGIVAELVADLYKKTIKKGS